MSILYRKSITGCESGCIRSMIQDMMNFIKSQYELTDDAEYEFRLILNELIANGTVHGNKKLCDKSITAQIETIDQDIVSITIQDEGCGFDYNSFLKNAYPCDNNIYSERGRGLKLISAICDSIRFNESGNQIRISKSVKKKSLL